MQKDFLPIGSVVLLEGGLKPLMVTGYKMKDKEDSDKEYDYVGCVFPEGFMEEIYALFDNDQISNVLYVGYEDEEFDKISQNIASGAIVVNNILDERAIKQKGLATPKGRRTPKAPTKPMSSSEMKAKYGIKKISGGQTNEVDFEAITDYERFDDLDK